MRWIDLGRLAVLWLVWLAGSGQLAAQYTLNGRVQDGSTGVPGVLIATTNFDSGFVLTAESASNGDFSFVNIPAGNYSVGAFKLDVEFDPDRYDIFVPTNTSTLIFQVVYQLGGRVVKETNGLEGVQINVTALGSTNVLRSTNTSASGDYLFPKTVAGFYVVTPSLADHLFEPTNRIVDVGPAVGTNRLDLDFQAFGPIAISGRVTVGGEPFPNVLLTAIPRSPGGTTMTNRTDAAGNYAFPVLVAGTYDLVPIAPGYSFTPPLRSVSATLTNADFSAVTASITGRVMENGTPLPGVLIQAGTNSVLTDAAGNYAFTQLSGPQVLVPSQDGHTFNPARVALSVSTGLGSVDFERGPTLVHTLIRTCDATSLDAALGAGGAVEFGCDGSFVLPTRRVITTNTTLDAAGLSVAISGSQKGGIFQIEPNVELVLQGLVLQGGRETGTSGTNGNSGAPAAGGAVLINGGKLAAVNCQFMSNGVAGGAGSAGITGLTGDGGDGGSGGAAQGGTLFNMGGAVGLTNCVLAFSTATAGAGGHGADAADLGGSNDGGNGGGGGAASGGAIHNTAGGRLTIVDCTFSNNVVSGAAGGNGGARSGLLGFPGENGQPGIAAGGSIFSDGGEISIRSSTFNGNRVTAANGGDGRAGELSVDGVAGTAGAASTGGGVHVAGGSLAMTNSTLAGNRISGGNGGKGGAGGTAGFGGDGGDGGKGGDALGSGLWVAAPATASLLNLTFVTNVVSPGVGGSGGAAGGSTRESGAPGAPGLSSGGAFAANTPQVLVANSLLAYTSGGSNVWGTFTDSGFNLCSDNSSGFLHESSRTGIDPLVGPLADNDGPTLTAALLPGSPAIDSADDSRSPPVDQRGLTRNGRSDIGAFEYLGQSASATLSIRPITGGVVISWPVAAGDLTLEGTPALTPAVWTTVQPPPVRVGFDLVVTNATTEPAQFYRLR